MTRISPTADDSADDAPGDEDADGQITATSFAVNRLLPPAPTASVCRAE